jgi:cytidine deaminase
MSIDENERENPYGQRVLDCYPHADFVLDCSDNVSLKSSVERLVNIYFGNPFISPTKDEYCSYFANAASYRSLDLSRQVGAAIFTDDCEVVSFGCNEVPKAGGGTYWTESGRDRRDFAIGYDSNQQVRQDMAQDALSRLKGKWLADRFKDLDSEELTFRAFEGSGAPLKGAMIADVIEYGRMVHAEMNAITDAARSRKSTQGATLYCTTMPCHMCTKLVIASGIKRVVYLQPYPKSLVEELYADSVVVDGGGEEDKVSFETLKGVTPNGFRLAFRKTAKRKNPDGTAAVWDPVKSRPVFLSHFPYYQQLEVKSAFELKKAIESLSSVEGVPVATAANKKE